MTTLLEKIISSIDNNWNFVVIIQGKIDDYIHDYLHEMI